MQDKTIQQHYNGYTVRPSAYRLPDGSFSANLLLERGSASGEAAQYEFHALDYFDNEAQAIRYSHRWGRDWVDNRG
ncbi:MAG: hypothetical protein ACRYG5_13225 [Janthinobacterium lividum]